MKERTGPISANEALRKLKEGNDRFLNNIRGLDSFLSQANKEELAKKQQTPFAIILCCSDSRAPAELIFDQGLGDLFVIRVAGNILAPSLVGSIEFAAAKFGTQLVVVMGHSQCGAVTATLECIKEGTKAPSDNIQDIVKRIEPNIKELVSKDQTVADQLESAIRANVRATVNQLKHGSRILEDLNRKNQLEIVGAQYDLQTGRVSFLD